MSAFKMGISSRLQCNNRNSSELELIEKEILSIEKGIVKAKIDMLVDVIFVLTIILIIVFVLQRVSTYRILPIGFLVYVFLTLCSAHVIHSSIVKIILDMKYIRITKVKLNAMYKLLQRRK